MKKFRVMTPNGVIADGEWGSKENIPARIPDRFNNYFDTAEADIIEVEVETCPRCWGHGCYLCEHTGTFEKLV